MYFETRKSDKYNQGTTGNQYNQGSQNNQGTTGNQYNQGSQNNQGMTGNLYSQENTENQYTQSMKDNKYYSSNKDSEMSQGSQSKYIRKMHDECEKLMNYHSLFATKDGTKFDGIILKVEDDCVIILVAEDILSDSDDDVADEKTRQYGYGNPRRFRRFVPRPYPYNNIGRVGLLPYPYFVPPYPYAVPLGTPYPFI